MIRCKLQATIVNIVRSHKKLGTKCFQFHRFGTIVTELKNIGMLWERFHLEDLG